MAQTHFLEIHLCHSTEVQFCRCPGAGICLKSCSPRTRMLNSLGIHYCRSWLLTSNGNSVVPENAQFPFKQKTMFCLWRLSLVSQPSQQASKPASQSLAQARPGQDRSGQDRSSELLVFYYACTDPNQSKYRVRRNPGNIRI